MLTVSRPIDVTSPSVTGLRLAALGRRVTASPALANAIGDLAFGPLRRDDVMALHVASAARIAASAGSQS